MTEPASAESAASKPGSTANLSDAKVELLLEQLRNKNSSFRGNQDSWTEFAKQIRRAALERHQYRDTAVIQESLEKLQNVIAANTLNQVLERIETACQKLGLKYSHNQGGQVYISTDMFYIEIQCDIAPTGRSIRDVRAVHHGTQATSMSMLTQALRQGNVQLFMEHIKGFQDMYNVTGEQSLKTKFFIVLQSLETDIERINKCQTQNKSISMGGHLYKTPLGYYQPRNGGLPTKLTFFITPYDFLNEAERTSYPMTLESIKNHDLGMSATIGIEQHPNSHQLQTIPLMSVNRQADGRIVPSFAPSTNVNSIVMPAAFVLKLKKPVALSDSIISQIEKLQGACSFSDDITMMPMLDAIVKSSGLTQAPGTQAFTVVLPGQVQKYYINKLESEGVEMRGGLVSKIPFSHPTGIPGVINLLRQQLMLNTSILSCVRVNSHAKAETRPVNLELKVVSHQLLTVTFKHPEHDRLVTVDIDISDLNGPKCNIYTSVTDDVCSNSHANKVIQRSYSIPITIRAILKQAGHQEENMPPANKKIKVDHGEIIQKLVDTYTARGHYMPFGSVNTASSSYTKNIQTNQYPLCLRRFSGYKRPSYAFLRSSHSSILNQTTKASSTAITNHMHQHPIPTQASDQATIASAPLIASLLDDKDHHHHSSMASSTTTTMSNAHPLVSMPSRGNPLQQSAPILTDLLEGPEGLIGADRKHNAQLQSMQKGKPRKKRTNSETSGPPSVGQPNRKRKKSESEDAYSRASIDFSDQSSMSYSEFPSPQKGLVTPTTPTSMARPSFSKPLPPSVPEESHLAKLLHGLDDEKNKQLRMPGANIHTLEMTAEDFLDPSSIKQEMPSAIPDSKTISKQLKRKSVDEKRAIKHSQSVESLLKDKKIIKTESLDSLKMKDVKPLETTSDSPNKRNSNKLPVKSKAGKLQVTPKGASIAGNLPLKTAEDRMSPNQKLKRSNSEKEKKKKTPKSPATAEPPQKSAQDLYKLGFYGASNLKSLPKIPKRKPGESQNSPTSPIPPSLPQRSPSHQKSPVPAEWQRTSPVPTSIQRNKALFTTSASSSSSMDGVGAVARRPALLPTPSAPPESTSSLAFRRTSLDENARKQNPTSPEAINSPDDKAAYNSSSAPVKIPVVPSEVVDPASPDQEIITHEPKSIPLDPGKRSFTPPDSNRSQSTSLPSNHHRLVKQKAIQRPLSFSPNPNSVSVEDIMI